MLLKIAGLFLVCQYVLWNVQAQCPQPNDNGLQCSLDCTTWGYCSNNQWIINNVCASNQLCLPGYPEIGCQESTQGEECVSPEPPYFNVECTSQILGQSIPNIQDASCSSYFFCPSSNGNAINLNCPSGQFDFCTRTCQSTSVECPTVARCTANQPLTVLSSNRQLAYTCFENNGETRMLWFVCNPGAFDSSGICVSTAMYNCGVTGNCTELGPIPLPNTNCAYRMCYPDGTYKDVPCISGYHYEHSQKSCISGACTPATS